jgi:para-nitrobenzyl esterase
VTQVRVDTGALAGQAEDGVTVYKGVPFARPPVGPLRWRPPQPPAPWSGVRQATEFSAAPIQPPIPRRSIMYHTNFADRVEPVFDEDCLYLNVWTPSPSCGARLPVLVFVHGGGNRFGYGSQDIHNGAHLAGRGIVVVTLNHRLGALGFLAHPGLDASGNYGLLDLIAALEWVQRNIEAFGGDPAAVTLAGNSAGAVHATHLMAAPAARGLFRAVIGQSAAGVFRAEGPMPALAAASRSGRDLFAGRSSEQLRAMPASELATQGPFVPIVDGRALPADTQAVFLAGGQAPVPLLVGSTTAEGAPYARPTDVSGHDEPGIQAAYPPDDPGSARRFVGDSRFVYPVWRWAKTHVETVGAPTWLYRFDREPPLPTGLDLAPPPDGRPEWGAFHTAELPYVFDNLDRRAWNWTDADRELADLMAGTWVAFVRDLDPGLFTWDRFDGAATGPVQVFAASSGPGRVERPSAMTLLDSLPRPL